MGGLLGFTLLLDLTGAACVVIGIISDGPRSPFLIGRVGPGLELPVAADREDPEHRAAIVWDEV